MAAAAYPWRQKAVKPLTGGSGAATEAAAADALTGNNGAATEHAEEPPSGAATGHSEELVNQGLVNQGAGLRNEAGAYSATDHFARRNEELRRKMRKVADTVRASGGILGRRMKNADTESTRPSPKYEYGQSVHHFWAAGIHDATDISLQQKKNARPKWYSAQIQSLPTWTASTCNGVAWEGWHYRAY